MSSLTKFRNLVVLTGAGISAESGIRTFRASDGLWENHRIEEVATPEGYEKDPNLVHGFYNQRRRQLKDSSVQPNSAHLALAQLEQEWEGEFLLVTQNVDNLHERAGSRRLVHMHGSLQKIFCLQCETRFEWLEDLNLSHTCAHCQKVGRLRPDIVWFGEMPYHMQTIGHALQSCEIFVCIGTSGAVYPAAGFVAEAHRARRIEVNVDSTAISSAFHERYVGPASIEVPKLVREFLNI